MTKTDQPTPAHAATSTGAAVCIDDEVWGQAVGLLAGARCVLLVCHVCPDGDALGSMLGLAHVLRRRGVTVTCTWGDERWARPASYSWLPGVDDTVPPDRAPADPDLLVVLDTGAIDRLGVLQERVRTAPSVLVVDHHAHGGDIGDPGRGGRADAVLCVDPAAAATAVVVEELVHRLGAGIDATVATCLYVGLVTDTGSFAHAVTTPAVHGVAARLLAAGVRPDQVARRVFGTRPIGVLRLLAYALARVHFDPDLLGGRGLIWTAVPNSVLVAHGLTVDDADAVMEAVRVTADADVAVVVKQDADGVWKVSSRSRGGCDVGSACAALGGGGHRLAAGFTALPAEGPGHPRGTAGEPADTEPRRIVAGFVAALEGGPGQPARG